MKTIRTILLLAVALAICKVYTAKAGDAGNTAKFIDSITVAPVGAVTHADLNGAASYSAGLDLGVAINPFVSIHGSALASEAGDWRGGVVDESEFYGKGVFARFKNESFALYGKGGAVRDWSEDVWGFGVGVGVQLRLTKSVSVAGDYTVRAWFKDRDKDGQLRALLNVSF